MDCVHCERKEKTRVEIRSLPKRNKGEITFTKNEIVFMTEGKVCFTILDYPENKLSKGQFIFIPTGSPVRYQVLEKTVVVAVCLSGYLRLCEIYHIEHLYRENSIAREPAGKEVCVLEINNPLWHFLTGLKEAVSGGLVCDYYFETKVKELCLLLKSYFPPEQLRIFFSHILTPDTQFSEYIRENFHRFRTSGELAASMNITLKHFEKTFTRVFGKPPGKWLKGERARMIYHELHSGYKPIKQIAYDFGFSTQQHLNRFCKRELGQNPGEIRRGKRHKIAE